ncbi:hypothetical protein DFH06DRAFT_327803 [Mycena polygramma]|nr:hypothetical protein DFH06DRAFT_327803 [Mycena polygramma]
MYIYLYPLCHQRRARATAAARPRSSDAEQSSCPGMQVDEEKRTLISWLHVRSRDRFSTHDSPVPKQSLESASSPGLQRQPSSFARGSLIPHLSPSTLTPPPPAYASRPTSPSAEVRCPSPLGSPRSEGRRSPRTPPPSPAVTASERPSPTLRAQFNPRHVPGTAFSAQGRSRSGTVSSPTLAVRPVMAPRSVSASTLHPMSGDLPTPSRARVYATEAGASTFRAPTGMPPTRPSRDGVGLGFGIGLAARGRFLTPPSVWNSDVVGHPF